VTLGISDNGQGFESDQDSPGHFGLSIIRERAEAIGAELSLETEPGGGTEITVIWIDLASTSGGEASQNLEDL
jgi:two-component system nitrate/nitrite sensor histidine kinase NarX